MRWIKLHGAKALDRGAGRRICRIMRKLLLILAAMAALATLYRLWSGPAERAEGLHLSGDGAPAVVPLLAAPRAPSEGAARLSAVLLHRWSNLRHVPGAAALCGAACAEPAVLVRVIALAPGVSRKHLFLNTAAAELLDKPDCTAAIIEAETAALSRPELPGCAGVLREDLRSVTLWRLPFDLGSFGG